MIFAEWVRHLWAWVLRFPTPTKSGHDTIQAHPPGEGWECVTCGHEGPDGSWP